MNGECYGVTRAKKKGKKKKNSFRIDVAPFFSVWHAKRFNRHRLSRSWRLTFFHADIPPTFASFSSPVTEEKQDVFEDVFSSTDKHSWHLREAAAVLFFSCHLKTWINGRRQALTPLCILRLTYASIPTPAFTRWILKCTANWRG